MKHFRTLPEAINTAKMFAEHLRGASTKLVQQAQASQEMLEGLASMVEGIDESATRLRNSIDDARRSGDTEQLAVFTNAEDTIMDVLMCVIANTSITMHVTLPSLGTPDMVNIRRASFNVSPVNEAFVQFGAPHAMLAALQGLQRKTTAVGFSLDNVQMFNDAACELVFIRMINSKMMDIYTDLSAGKISEDDIGKVGDYMPSYAEFQSNFQNCPLTEAQFRTRFASFSQSLSSDSNCFVTPSMQIWIDAFEQHLRSNANSTANVQIHSVDKNGAHNDEFLGRDDDEKYDAPLPDNVPAFDLYAALNPNKPT